MKLYDIKENGKILIKTKNRYAQIHVLFRLLAQEKLDLEKKDLGRKKWMQKLKDGKKINELAMRAKDYWKNFYSINSLKELGDKELDNLERLIRNRIKMIQKLKDLKYGKEN